MVWQDTLEKKKYILEQGYVLHLKYYTIRIDSRRIFIFEFQIHITEGEMSLTLYIAINDAGVMHPLPKFPIPSISTLLLNVISLASL